MEYLVKKKKGKVAHVWIKVDTVCRLYSTGGLNKKRYKVVFNRGSLPICLLCDKSDIDRRNQTDKEAMEHILSIKAEA